MKLLTTIPPRLDDTMTATLPDGTEYKFERGDKGLEASIENQDHVAWMIQTGQFYPADKADFPAAESLVSAPNDEGYEITEVNAEDDPEFTIDLDTADEASLRAYIEQETGKPPHHKAGIDRLREIAKAL